MEAHIKVKRLRKHIHTTNENDSVRSIHLSKQSRQFQ